jgi:hypothetical protein
MDLTLKEHHEGYHTLTKCPPSIGYSNLQAAERKKAAPSTTTSSQVSAQLLAKHKAKAMALAMQPGKQIGMNAFMMYMSGKTLNIFSISVTSSAIMTPIMGLFSVEKTFANLDLDSSLPKLIFVACNLGWLALGLYKMSSMRLLPTTSADFADSIVFKDMMEASSIPPPMFM